MSRGLAKQLAAKLVTRVLGAVGALERAPLRAERWTFQEMILWQWWLSLRITLLALVFLGAAYQWNWSRLQIDGPLSDRLLQDVLAERVIQHPLERQFPWSTRLGASAAEVHRLQRMEKSPTSTLFFRLWRRPQSSKAGPNWVLSPPV